MHTLAQAADVPTAELDDLAWADAVLFGAPTRFGDPASQLRAFVETTDPLWAQGEIPLQAPRVVDTAAALKAARAA
ncbi:hypothetical protein ACQEU3_36655 [Spirillospora sp. CA-253888]